jgi:hypothetical protein
VKPPDLSRAALAVLAKIRAAVAHREGADPAIATTKPVRAEVNIANVIAPISLKLDSVDSPP